MSFRATLTQVIGAIAWAPSVLSAQDTAGQEARDLAVAELRAESYLLGSSAGRSVDASGVAVGQLDMPAPGLRVWQVSVPSMPHSHGFLVAEAAGEFARVGGFSAPELMKLDRFLAGGGLTIDARAIQLAWLADPEGMAEGLVPSAMPPGDNADRALLENWSRSRPAAWPVDSTWTGRSGDKVIRITAVSRIRNTSAPAGVAVAYTFIFSARGELQAWSRRLSEVFPLRN